MKQTWWKVEKNCYVALSVTLKSCVNQLKGRWLYIIINLITNIREVSVMVRSNKIIKGIICLAVMLSVIMTSDAVKLYKNDAQAAEGESTVAFLYFQDKDGNISINSPDSEALTPVTVASRK